jgi:hypothetical protein
MNNNYIVVTFHDCWDSKFGVYIQRVISYKNKKYKVTVLIEKAFRYKIESNAIKAAQLCNGEIKIV